MSSVYQSELETLLCLVASKYLGQRIKLEWFSRSHFSSIACFRLVDEPDLPGVVIKTIMPWHLDTLQESQRDEVAKLWNDSTTHFRSLLQQYGVPVARSYECLYQDGYAFQVSSEEGTVGDIFIARLNESQQPKAIHQIVEGVAGVLDQPEQPVVGLDPQLSNFGFVTDGDEFHPIYFDVFPPLCWFNGQHLVHYPNPENQATIDWELDRKFRPLGILRRLRFSILSIDLDLEEAFLAALKDVLAPDLFGQAHDFFESLPDAALNNGFNSQSIRQLIDGLSPQGQGIDTIREFSARLADRDNDLSRPEFLELAFDLSRKDTCPGHEEPHSVRFNQLQNRLLSLV